MNIQYITNEKGRKTAVVVSLKEWEKIMAKVRAFEEIEFLTPEDERDRKRAVSELQKGEALDLREALREW